MDFQYALPGRKFDFILADVDLAASEEWKALQLARQNCSSTPFILLADSASQNVVDGLQVGAWDCVLRNNLPLLPFIICRARERGMLAVEEHLRFHAELLNLTDESILVRDASGVILYWNESAARLYGWSAAEAVGRNVQDLLGSAVDGSLEQLTQGCARTGSWEGQLVRIRKDGTPLQVLSRWKARWTAGRTLQDIVEVDSDESAMKRLEAHFGQPARSFSGEDAKAIHEMNNMLAAIGNVAELLKTRITGEQEKTLLHILETSAQRAGQLARRMPRPEPAEVVAPAPTVASKAMYADEKLRGNGELVLVVDDEDLVRDLFRTFLTHHGYQVAVARDGEEAMRLFRENYQRVDLVVCDLGLPTMQGRDVVHQMRMIKPRLKLIISSGNDSGSDPFEGAETFLKKPYDIDTALRAIRAKLDEVSPYAARNAAADVPLVLKLAI